MVEMAWGKAQHSGDYSAWVRAQTSRFRQSRPTRGIVPLNRFAPKLNAPQHEPLLKKPKTKTRPKSYATGYMMATAERIGVTKPYVSKQHGRFLVNQPTNVPDRYLLKNRNLLLKSKLAVFWDEDTDSFKDIVNETPKYLPLKPTGNVFQKPSRSRQK